MIFEHSQHDKKILTKSSKDFQIALLTKEKNQKERLEHAHKEFSNALLKYAYLRVHNKGLSEDLVQETFLKTWRYVIRGGDISIMKSFLYHILNGLIIDEYRKQTHRISSLDLLTDNGFDVSTDEHKHKGDAVDISTVTNYIESLPEKYKRVLYMRIILCMSPEEISNELHQTKNTVTVQLHRGLKRIQDLHKKKCELMNYSILF